MIADDVNKERTQEMKDNLKKNLEQARRQVNTAFEVTGGGEG